MLNYIDGHNTTIINIYTRNAQYSQISVLECDIYSYRATETDTVFSQKLRTYFENLKKIVPYNTGQNESL